VFRAARVFAGMSLFLLLATLANPSAAQQPAAKKVLTFADENIWRTSSTLVMSADGSHIAFNTTRDGAGNVYQKATSGVAPDEALDKAARAKRPDDWSRDGRYLIEELSAGSNTGTDIWVLPLSPERAGGDRKPFPYLQTEFNERSAKLSPNGQWLAYASDETKRYEIYVQTFPTPGGKWQVSTNGGSYPRWSRDGKELFFIGADQKLMAVDVKPGAKFEPGLPKPLFDVRISADGYYDVSKDGRFLIPAQIEQALKLSDQVESIAKKYVDANGMLFFGRQFNYPILTCGGQCLDTRHETCTISTAVASAWPQWQPSLRKCRRSSNQRPVKPGNGTASVARLTAEDGRSPGS